MTKDEALKLALEALEYASTGNRRPEIIGPAITDIKEALAQPEQEPWATREDFYCELNRRVERMRKEMEIKTVTMRCKEYDIALPIIEAHFGHVFVGQVFKPPQRPWVGLTEEERSSFWTADYMTQKEWDRLFDSIEDKLKQKNT